jgi:hypothetical protein
VANAHHIDREVMCGLLSEAGCGVAKLRLHGELVPRLRRLLARAGRRRYADAAC